MNKIKVYVTTLQFFIYFSMAISKDLYNLDMYRWTCGENDPRIVYNLSCSTRIINRTHKAHSMIAFGRPEIIFDDIHVKIELFQKTGTSYSRKLISAEEDFCGYLAGTSRSMLIKLVWPSIRKRTNLKAQCPFTKMIHIKDFIIDYTYFPPYMPEGFSRIEVHVRSGPKRLSMAKVLAFIEIKPKGAMKLIF